MKNIAVLISGNGSNLQAIIDAKAQQSIAGNISVVISNKGSAYGLQRAQQANIASEVLSAKAFDNRKSYDDALLALLQSYDIDIVVLAGFMRILSPHLVDAFNGAMLNIHPSLLPKYPGLHTHQQCLDAGDAEHGVTVHFVNAELDGGPLIAHSKLTVNPEDTAESLQQRVHQLEHSLYPKTLSWLCDERLKLVDNIPMLDNQPIPAQGIEI